MKDVIYSINGPVVTVKDTSTFGMAEMVYVGNAGLIGEVISVSEARTTIQVYENTTGLLVGEPVKGTGAPLSATLGPGIMENIFDGIERPLTDIAQKNGAFIATGVHVDSLDMARRWDVTVTVKPGDSVVMEEPVHPDMYRVMELAGAKILTVPVDENGMNCEVLESLLTQTRPRLIFVNSSYHDPTGNILSLERRKKIVELSNRYRVPIVEEDAASELVYDGDKLPPIKAFDTTGNVIYIYSFSLTFIPGLSLAFVTGNRDLIRALSYLVSVRLMASDWMTQKLLGMYLDDGIYYTSLLKFRDVYRTNRDLVCQKLDELAPLGVSYTKPRGGVYVWCRLPDGVDSKRFIRRAYNMGVTLIPGHVFYPCKNGGRDHIRINYSYEPRERLERGREVLRKALEEELGE